MHPPSPRLRLALAVAGLSLAPLAALFAPVSASAGSSSKARGAELFASAGCAHCHGPNGVGGGKGPDLQLVRKRLTRQQIVAQIHDGGRSMPAFADQLSAQQIDDLASFLRAHRKYIPVPPRPSAPLQPPPSQDQ